MKQRMNEGTTSSARVLRRQSPIKDAPPGPGSVYEPIRGASRPLLLLCSLPSAPPLIANTNAPPLSASARRLRQVRGTPQRRRPRPAATTPGALVCRAYALARAAGEARERTREREMCARWRCGFAWSAGPKAASRPSLSRRPSIQLWCRRCRSSIARSTPAHAARSTAEHDAAVVVVVAVGGGARCCTPCRVALAHMV